LKKIPSKTPLEGQIFNTLKLDILNITIKKSIMAKINFENYATSGFYDEMFDENGTARPHYKLFLERLEKIG